MNNRYREIVKTLTATGWVFMLTIILIAACTLIFGCHSEEEYIESMVVPEVPVPEEPEPVPVPEEPEPVPVPEEPEPVPVPEEPEPVPEPEEPIYTPNPPPAAPSRGTSGQFAEPYQQATVSHAMEPGEFYCLDLRRPVDPKPNCFGPRLYIRDRHYHRSVEWHHQNYLAFIERAFLISEKTSPKSYFVPYDQEDPVVFLIADWLRSEAYCYPYSYIFTMEEGFCE